MTTDGISGCSTSFHQVIAPKGWGTSGVGRLIDPHVLRETAERRLIPAAPGTAAPTVGCRSSGEYLDTVNPPWRSSKSPAKWAWAPSKQQGDCHEHSAGNAHTCMCERLQPFTHACEELLHKVHLTVKPSNKNLLTRDSQGSMGKISIPGVSRSTSICIFAPIRSIHVYVKGRVDRLSVHQQLGSPLHDCCYRLLSASLLDLVDVEKSCWPFW